MVSYTDLTVPSYVCAEMAGTGRPPDPVDAPVRRVVVNEFSQPDALDWLAAGDRDLADRENVPFADQLHRQYRQGQ